MTTIWSDEAKAINSALGIHVPHWYSVDASIAGAVVQWILKDRELQASTREAGIQEEPSDGKG